MVGQRPLKPLIGVRVPVGQHKFEIRSFPKVIQIENSKKVGQGIQFLSVFRFGTASAIIFLPHEVGVGVGDFLLWISF